MRPQAGRQRSVLRRIARRAMIDRGLLPDFSPEALEELRSLREAAGAGAGARDLRSLPWASIDNDDTMDIDQLTVAARGTDGTETILVAVADVDALVGRGSALDWHARQNTTTVYTAAEIFPMIPERLSTDLTSLSPEEDRCALVIEMRVSPGGPLLESDLYPAIVRNRAKLAYGAVAAWLDGGAAPGGIDHVAGLAENLRVQDRVARGLRRFRQEHGTLNLETLEARPVFEGEEIRDMVAETRNRAKELIEEFMIAANGVTARRLKASGFPALLRVVRSPRRWARIVEVAARLGTTLPSHPDPVSLGRFLDARRQADPLRFPDLSLTVVKLLGPGEYDAEFPGEVSEGHFGLAVRDYAHSTAPNRRYADLVTHRLLKAALIGASVPYSREELTELALRCTEKENDANKVERQVAKSAAAMLLAERIGESFNAIVTGAADKGTWVRLLEFPIEGKLVRGLEGVDVGDRLSVRLIHTDVERGHIDFERE